MTSELKLEVRALPERAEMPSVYDATGLAAIQLTPRPRYSMSYVSTPSQQVLKIQPNTYRYNRRS